MRTYEHIILNQSVSSNTSSSSVDCRHLTFLSFQVNATGTLDADVSLQLSNDGIDYVDVPATSQNFSGNSVGMIEVVDVCAAYAKVYIAVNSGTSTVKITMINKGNS